MYFSLSVYDINVIKYRTFFSYVLIVFSSTSNYVFLYLLQLLWSLSLFLFLT